LCNGGKYGANGIAFPVCPSGFADNGDTATGKIYNDYYMLDEEVPRILWNIVYEWAIARKVNAYSFSNESLNSLTGEKGELFPVLSTWRNAIVWCNAFTEYCIENNAGGKLEIVYYKDADYTIPIRDSGKKNDPIIMKRGSIDEPYIKAEETGNTDPNKCIANGFRLPKRFEWDFAARYRGNDSSNSVKETIDGINFEFPTNNIYWTKGNSASGANSSYKNWEETKKVAWTAARGLDITKGTIQRIPNALGIYDMSGNFLEWNFEWYPQDEGKRRIIRGGDCGNVATVQIGVINSMYGNPAKDVGALRIVKNK
jgi:hypothetical protein